MSPQATAAGSQKVADWIVARKRFRLSDAQVQMARELGLNPKKLGGLDNRSQEPWKQPLPEFIEHLYLKRFGRERPAAVMSIEVRERQAAEKKAARKRLQASRQSDAPPGLLD